ncbi:hypothetical protein [Bdellovibrio sp. HCB337]|uniref:hypothetical protein n=1 Tax=Bdellovibrio sp. HCB337 TaxID=3394358 RepID=UPI0039A40C76
MKKLVAYALIFASPWTHAKLSDRQAMKCIDGDKATQSAFQDLQAAFEMRMVTAKDFLKVMDKPASCPQLRKDLKKLHTTALAQLPQSKSAKSHTSGLGSGGNSDAYSPIPTPGGYSPPPLGNFNDEDMGFPPPPPLPDSDFEEDDFDDFR